MTTDDLLTFNLFGLARVQRNQVSVHYTAKLKNGKSINLTLVKELDTPIAEISPEESALIVFGALIEEDNKSRFAINEMSELASGKQVGSNEQVGKVLKETVKIVRKEAQLP